MAGKNIPLEKIVNMKTLSALLITFLIPFGLMSQVAIDTITYAYPGDTIVRYADLTPENVEITDAGGDQLWQWMLSDSLVQIASFDTNDRKTDYPFATIKMTENLRESYFFINDINWGLQGFVAEDPVGLGLVVSSFYSPAFSQEYAPVVFEDTVVQVFGVFTGIPLSIIPDSVLETLPVIPDSLRLKVSTLVIDDIDAWGELEINGSSIDVLRQRRENRIAIAVEAKVSILPWVDITDLLLDFVDSLPGGITLTDTFVSYRFLAPGYEMPIADLTVDDDNVVTSVVFQADVLSANREVVFTSSEIKIFPNPTSGEINISLENSEHDIDRIVIMDLAGRLVQVNQIISNQDIFNVRLTDVPDGMYFLTLIDAEGKLLGSSKVSLIDN